MKSLWLDIGNTRLKYWLCEHQTVVAHAAEMHLQSPADLLLGLIEFFKTQSIQQVGLSSVLDPDSNQRILTILSQLNLPIFSAKVADEYAGLRCGYTSAQQLGVDRWLQVLAVAKADEQVCVIGCGTALTIDLVDGLQHLGGYILPNLYLQREALIGNTKGINVPADAFDSLKPGQNTADAVHHGILLGLVSAIQFIHQQHMPAGKLVLTGGDAALFAPFIAALEPEIQPDLLLRGLQYYVQHQGNNSVA